VTWQLLLGDLLAIGIVSLAIGYGGHRLPAGWFEHDTWLTRPRRFEDGGRLYARRLRIKRWKRVRPEAGAIFHGGFDKKRLRSTSDAHLRVHLRETRRAEVVHWCSALSGLPLFAWNPAPTALVLAATLVVGNAPFVATLRYNRLRLARILRLRSGEP
jgi:glycosyl-4,4'-diaponeurosporenoate acyltransferase